MSSEPFFFNRETQVKLYYGTSRKDGKPIVAKCHEIQYVKCSKAEFTKQFNKAMNTGLAQARIDHLHSCKILEICLDVDISKNIYFVYHILEALDKDLGKEIEERKRRQQIPRENEVQTFLAQTSAALAYAHSKAIAHRDLKPANIFMNRYGVFKVGDFGSYFESQADMPATTATGTLFYMSPEQRSVWTGTGENYNAYKGDVFSLGLTTLAFASATLVERPWLLDRLRISQEVEAVLQGLRYSEPLKNLLRSMLAYEEGARYNMQQVCAALAPPAAAYEAPQPETQYEPESYYLQEYSQPAAPPMQTVMLWCRGCSQQLPDNNFYRMVKCGDHADPVCYECIRRAGMTACLCGRTYSDREREIIRVYIASLV